MDERIEQGLWPLRAWLLLAIGAASGVAFHLLTRGEERWLWTDDPVRLAAATFIAVGGIAFAFTLERARWAWSLAFALLAGLALALVIHWNGTPDGWSAGEGWRLLCGLIAVAIAAPFFQTARDSGRWRIDYRTIHGHAWTNVVLWFAAWLFVLITYLLLQLLAELFGLIGLDFLKDLLREGWFVWGLTGGALGAAIGLLRDRDRVLGLLQRVVTTVLSVLAPLLAAGLVLFVAALPFTGLAPLWEQTVSTTPILLACIVGAIILANAVIGNAPEEESSQPLLRYGAMALAAVILPLAVVAALSTGMRIGQHGFTPERLWAATFVAIACAYGIAYLWVLVRGRVKWGSRARSANIYLALGLCLVVLLLSTPLLGFNAISARDQVARLRSGQMSPAEFDWAALRFDFGEPGRRQVERLAREGGSEIRTLAERALKEPNRYDLLLVQENAEERARSPDSIRVRPVPAPIPADLKAAILADGDLLTEAPCLGEGECQLFWQPGDETAVVLLDGCARSVVSAADQIRANGDCRVRVTVLKRDAARWRTVENSAGRDGIMDGAATEEMSKAEEEALLKGERAAIDAGDVEIREVTRRQVFIGGKPASGLFE